MKILIFSDIHFYNNPSKSYLLDNGRYSWFDGQLRLISTIFQLAKHEEVDMVIHNGDLFHEKTRINVALYNDVWQFFQDHTDDGFDIVFNTGNHDLLTTTDSSLRPFSDIVAVHTTPWDIKLGDTILRIIPYGQIDGNLALPSQHFENKILFTHADISGLKYGPNDFESGARLKHQIFADWDIVFNGHIHKPQELDNIVNIGSPMITDWGEADEYKRVIIYEDGEWESRHLTGPLFTTFDSLSDKLKKKIEKDEFNFFRIDVDSEQLKDPIFNKYNVFPRVVKTKKRELRLKDTNSVSDEIEKYVDITETKLDKKKLLEIGRGLLDE